MTTAGAWTIADETLARLERAWNVGDGTAFGEAFGIDADFVDIRGGHHHGADVVAAGHQHLFDTLYAGSAMRYWLETARIVAPERLHARLAGATLEIPAGPAAGVSQARLTAVLTSDGETWSLAALHNASSSRSTPESTSCTRRNRPPRASKGPVPHLFTADPPPSPRSSACPRLSQTAEESGDSRVRLTERWELTQADPNLPCRTRPVSCASYQPTRTNRQKLDL